MNLTTSLLRKVLGAFLILFVILTTVARAQGANAVVPPAGGTQANAAAKTAADKAAADKKLADAKAAADKLLSLLKDTVQYVKIEGDTTKSGKPTPLKIDFNTRIVLYLTGNPKHYENQDSARIYINNKMMPYKVVFNCPCIDPTSKVKYFTLTCTLAPHDTSWNKWYGFKDDYLAVKVDAGTIARQITCTTGNNLSIKMFNQGALTFGWIAVILFFIVSIIIAFVAKSELIKDHSNLLANKPYSLSRFQLLWWTVIIIASYILLFAIRDDFSLLSNSTLILLGISAAGTGFASVVDYSDSDKDRHQDQPSRGFFIDILSDNDGISVHRYQNFIFTIVFGIVFIYKVLSTANMPDFGQLELALMGLSTATYVGLKAGENKNQPTTTADPDSTTNPTENIVG